VQVAARVSVREPTTTTTTTTTTGTSDDNLLTPFYKTALAGDVEPRAAHEKRTENNDDKKFNRTGS